MLAAALLASLVAACGSAAVVVDTNSGPVQGYVETVMGVDMAAFRGIPYAAPPVGRSGRWKPPVPPKPWTEPLNTTQDQSMCYQFLGNVQSSSVGGIGESEDCLYLNVFSTRALTPASTPVPVMFWIYGGGLVIGSLEAYGAIENLVALANGDVMIVAVSYRLNALGFLALEELTKEDPRGTSGNYGILDIQLALQWTQKNVASFGGDASRVTVYGQSSGGTAIFALLASPASRGLFHGAITLSGGEPSAAMTLCVSCIAATPLCMLSCISCVHVHACRQSTAAAEPDERGGTERAGLVG
jgi:para-nitrobenzyl esterase